MSYERQEGWRRQSGMAPLCCHAGDARRKKGMWGAFGSVVYDSRVPLKYGFRSGIQLTGHFMDLILLATLLTAHSHSAAHSQDFEGAVTFLALHIIFPGAGCG